MRLPDKRTMQYGRDGIERWVGAVSKSNFPPPILSSYDQMQFMLAYAGTGANRQVYSSMEDVPLSFSVPPPVEVPVGADGVQEVTLVVTAEGYSPVHFAVKKDVPVRLIFRQLGEVGCGNELIFQLGNAEERNLDPRFRSDKQSLRVYARRSR